MPITCEDQNGLLCSCNSRTGKLSSSRFEKGHMVEFLTGVGRFLCGTLQTPVALRYTHNFSLLIEDTGI